MSEKQIDKIRPYGQDESKKSEVSQMFNRIAPYYDFLNRLLSMGVDQYWRRVAIGKLRDSGPQHILDVATGTGDVAIMAARLLRPTSIVGVDISNEMLEIGKAKIKNKGLEKLITLKEGDSENLPFPSNTFDAITVAFGVRNYENLEKGLSDMLRVLKPGGKLVILEFSRPRIFPFKQIFNAYFKYLLPLIGRFTSKDPRAYQYLYESVQAFPEGPAMLGIMNNTGYKSTQCTPLTLGICSVYTGQK